MRIEVKGRNVAVKDEYRDRLERKLDKVSRQVSELAECEVELREERNPSIRDSQVAEATLHLKGVTIRASERSEDMEHSLNLLADAIREAAGDTPRRRKRRAPAAPARKELVDA